MGVGVGVGGGAGAGIFLELEPEFFCSWSRSRKFQKWAAPATLLLTYVHILLAQGQSNVCHTVDSRKNFNTLRIQSQGRLFQAFGGKLIECRWPKSLSIINF